MAGSSIVVVILLLAFSQRPSILQINLYILCNYNRYLYISLISGCLYIRHPTGLWAWWLRFNAWLRQEIFLYSSVQTSSGDPPSLLSNGYWGLFPQHKAVLVWSWPLTYIYYRRSRIVELYLHSPMCLHGMVLNSWSPEIIVTFFFTSHVEFQQNVWNSLWCTWKHPIHGLL
jgi:hypothetical protein